MCADSEFYFSQPNSRSPRSFQSTHRSPGARLSMEECFLQQRSGYFGLPSDCRNSEHAIILLLIIHTLDLFVFFNRFNPFVPKALVFRLSDNHLSCQKRRIGIGDTALPILPQTSLPVRHVFPEGYDPLYPKWYGEFLYSYRNGSPLKQFDNATRSDAAITSNFGDGGLSGLNKQKILNA